MLRQQEFEQRERQEVRPLFKDYTKRDLQGIATRQQKLPASPSLGHLYPGESGENAGKPGLCQLRQGIGFSLAVGLMQVLG